MRMRRCQLWLWSIAFVASGPASAEQFAPDFLLSILRFGIECRGPETPRKVYLGDEARFAVRVAKPSPSPALSEGEKQSPPQVTYRAFYRDLSEPNAADAAVTLRCRAGAKCIAAYRSGAVERVSAIRLDTCSSRTATLVTGAAREFIRSGHP